MNCFVWNYKGVNGKHFLNLVKDYIKMYNLNFVAILEPRINVSKAENVVRKNFVDDGVHVEANDFFGGILCLRKTFCPSNIVTCSSQYCIHLRISSNSLNRWVLYIV